MSPVGIKACPVTESLAVANAEPDARRVLTCSARQICHMDVKCPAIHVLPGLSLDNYNVGTAMHLIALLGFNRPFLRSYDVRRIQEIHDKARSAQTVYLLLQEDIKRAVQQKKKLHQHAIRKLIEDSEKVPDMGKKALSTITSMIVKLVEQQT